jgi:RHS repeat-associated protein
MRPRLVLLALVFLLLLFASPAKAQVSTGTPPFGSFGGGPDTINLSNLNVHLGIPVFSRHGRGTDFSYTLAYDSTIWSPVVSGSTTSWQPVVNFGWSGQTQALNGIGYIAFYTTSIKCFGGGGGNDWWLQRVGSHYYYFDTFGTWHYFDTGTVDTCSNPGPATVQAYDGSGHTLYADPGNNVAQIYVSTGQVVTPPQQKPVGAAGFTDRNGNELSVDGAGHFTDTLGTVALTISGAAPSPQNFTYTAPSGSNVSVAMSYKQYTVKTNFGCSYISEYGPTSIYLVDKLTLPDGTYYQFRYEATPLYSSDVTGRLASVTLPTGGTLSYTYTGGSQGVTCADGSTAGLKRYTPDTGSNYWEYDRTAGAGAAYTTTITDPVADKTVIQFQGLYETERDFYQGAISSSNLLQTIKTCYNGNTTNCNSTAVGQPITQRNITTILSGGLQSEHDDLWNTYGAPTETDDYDYGSGSRGPLLKKMLTTYDTNLGTIAAFRQTVTVCNGSGSNSSCNGTGTPVSMITYNYDETPPTQTSGTPAHVNLPAPWGNLTSTNVYISSGTYLRKTWTYYDTGNLNQFTDVNGGVTTYNYASGAASCYNSFATSITEPVAPLFTSQTWNCAGGVQLTSTDENSQTTTTAYTDHYFWRQASVTDPTGAVTSYCYGLLNGTTCSLNPNQAETTLSFNGGNSTVDPLTNLDGLGRVHVKQTRQAPSSLNFDSVETDYDSLGRVSRVTLPYTGTAGQANSSIPSTTTTYDAMNRQLTTTDGGGGTVTYFYGNPGSQNNDTLVTQGPAPTGENAKVRQFENDGLARLTSVCEVTAGTSGWPGGTCGQSTSKTGYWTKYTHDPMNNLLTVSQNAQSSTNQTRTYVYDWMSRMTSQTVPEIGASGNGTATYAYDSDSTCGNYSGDLVKEVDAAGDVICTTYDALHRKLATTYPSGPYASVTPAKHFIYDAATINTSPTHTAMSYVKGRLAEAYTCTGSCATYLKDVGFSYSVRGENSDLYESTPNSGTYYHLNQTYWANRAPYQLTGNIGLPATISNNNPDGEGRANTITASSGQSPLVSGTNYNAASLPTVIKIGSGTGDQDAYSYDPNTNRMTQYQFTVNNTSLTGGVGWNANSTLVSQSITDGFNAPDTQNCSYGYDDMVRVTSANCGSAASQTFSFDPFGNVNKSGSPYSFNPTYSESTNRIQGVSGTNATYDSNGNATYDTYHHFTWDANGHTISVDAGLSGAVSLTYDALGRMVEQSRSGASTQIVYAPTGQKFALMSGQTLQKAMVPLPGNAFGVYNSSGLLYYAHPDFLGTVRLATTPSRALYFDTAYAPFGETYASMGTLDPAYTGMMNDTSHRQDTANGLYDFPAREYSTQGRWPNPDPLGKDASCAKNPQTQNLYAYVGGNPLSYTDPTGMMMNMDPGDGGGESCDPFDPFCDPCYWEPELCTPWEMPMFYTQFVEEKRPFPWLLLPLGLFDRPQVGSRWSCLNTDKGGKPFYGVCFYECARLGYSKTGPDIATVEVSMGQMRRDCGWTKSTCAPSLTLSGPTANLTEFLFGFKIEACYAEGGALIP